MAVNLKEIATRKLGPFPTWVWVAGGAGVMLLFLRKKGKTSAGTSALLPSGTGYVPGSGLSGGSGGGGTTLGGGTGSVTCPPGYALDSNGNCVPVALPAPQPPPVVTPPAGGGGGGTPSSPVPTLAQLAAQWGLQPGGHYIGGTAPGSRIGWANPNGTITYWQELMPQRLISAFWNTVDPFTGLSSPVHLTGGTAIGNVSSALSSGATGAPAAGSRPAPLPVATPTPNPAVFSVPTSVRPSGLIYAPPEL